jgi:hypothetical protein
MTAVIRGNSLSEYWKPSHTTGDSSKNTGEETLSIFPCRREEPL